MRPFEAPPVIGLLDEFGDPARTPSGSRYLVVVLMVATHLRPVLLHVRRARRALGARTPGGELKASHARPKVAERLLGALAVEDIAIYVSAVHKHAKIAIDGEPLYRNTVARAVRACVERTPRLHLILDKRYTNRRQQLALETSIREEIADIAGHVVLIEQGDSAARPELQAVDFVAWAFGQKYERGDEQFARIVAAKVVIEDVLK